MKSRITLLPGDGIGPEIVEAARQVLESIGRKFGHSFAFSDAPDRRHCDRRNGGAAARRHHRGVSKRRCGASCAVGGPKWDDPTARVRPEQGLLGMRKVLKLFANVRPVKLFRSLEAASPLKADRLRGVDLVFIRELTAASTLDSRKAKRCGMVSGPDSTRWSTTKTRSVGSWSSPSA